MQRQGECCHELTGNSVCVSVSARYLEQAKKSMLPHTTLARASSSQRSVCVSGPKWLMRHSSQVWRVIPFQFTCLSVLGKLEDLLSLCCLEWAAICALFRKERNTTNCCMKFPRWVQGLLPATEQPGFAFVWKMLRELWLAWFLLSVDFRIKGSLASWGLLILVCCGSFQLPCHSPFRWLPVGFFLTFFCIYCQDVNQVKGVTLRSMSVIFWNPSFILE